MTTTDVISQFISRDVTNYLAPAAEYLEARGLAANEDVKLKVNCAVRTRFSLDAEGRRPFIAEGWGYQIRALDGSYKDNEYLMRVCNYPESLYHNGELYTSTRPKFLQTNRHPIVHFCGGEPDHYYQSPVISIHEKISSGTLMWKHLRVPSVAISGCTGWGKNGRLHPELAQLLRTAAGGATLVVHFDGDINSNPNVYRAAGALMGAVGTARPDLHVRFVPLPGGAGGWDDWWVAGATAQQWLDLLSAEGVEVSEQLPLAWLREQYGISTSVTRNAEQLEQTADNYTRLLQHPRWSGLRWDLTGDCYADNEVVQCSLEMDYQRWVERTVCAGYGGKVNVGRLQASVSAFVQSNTIDMAASILRAQPRPTYDEFRAAALGVAAAWPSYGTLQGEEYVQTLMRMARDLIALWGGDGGSRVQWILGIVGPPGIGKTTAIERLMQPVVSLGLRTPAIGELPKIKQQMDQKELVRILRDNRWALMDDLNHKTTEADARASFNMLYTVSSGLSVRQREMRQERAVAQPRHAAMVVTSVDREFIRTPKDTGERRFIVWEVRGRCSDEWSQHWLTLLVGAAHGLPVAGDATEFSQRYVKEYVRESMAHNRLAMMHINWDTVLMAVQSWHRGSSTYPLAEPYRFSSTMLARAMGLEAARGVDSAELMTLAMECGAVRIGKGRVTDKGKEVFKDLTYGIADAEAFISALSSKLT